MISVMLNVYRKVRSTSKYLSACSNGDFEIRSLEITSVSGTVVYAGVGIGVAILVMLAIVVIAITLKRRYCYFRSIYIIVQIQLS